MNIATHYRLKLTPITPIVIGCDEKIDQSEYYSQSGRLYVVDIMRYLSDYPHKRREYIEKISNNKGTKFSLNKDMPEIKKKESYVKYSLAIMGKISRQITAFVKNGEGKVYIPGSSVKGAVRTALAFGEAEKQIDKIPRITTKINKNNHIIDEFVYRPQSQDRKKDIHYDLLRFLTFSDSGTFLPQDILEVFLVEIISGAKDGKTFSPFAVEAWTGKKSVEIEMSIPIDTILDRSLNRIGLNDRKKLLTEKAIQEALNKFALQTLQYDIEVIEALPNKDKLSQIAEWDREMLQKIKNAPPNIAYISLGQGQGWHRITDATILDATILKKEFSRFIEKNFGGKHKKAKPPFPKSRRVTQYNNQTVPLGWAKIEFLGEGKIKRDVSLPEIKSSEKPTEKRTTESAPAPPAITPTYSHKTPEKEPQGSSNKAPDKKLKGIRFLEQLKNEQLINILNATFSQIAELIYVKELIANFSKEKPNPQHKINDILLPSQISDIEIIISDGEKGVKITVWTYAKTQEERNFVANKIWEIIKPKE